MSETISRRSPASSQSGLTLVETLVALFLVSVVVVSLTALFTQSMRTNYRSRAATDATTIARSKVEELRALPFDAAQLDTGGALDPNAPQTGYWDGLDADGMPVSGNAVFTRLWQVVLPDVTNPDLKQITVFVRFDSPLVAQPITVQTTTLVSRV